MTLKIKMKQADGKVSDVIFSANAATPIRFKHVFHKDFWKILGGIDEINHGEILEQLDTIGELAFIMHCQGENRDMNAITYDDYVAWLETLDGMAILSNAKTILSLYIAQNQSASVPKK